MSVEKCPSISKQNWLRATCSNTSLFLSVYELSSSIFEYSLLPTIELIKQWKTPDTCRNNELINHLRSNGKTLALIITSPLNQLVRLDLKTSDTFLLLWSLSLAEKKLSRYISNCCSFNNDEWLVISSENNQLLHINSRGQVQSRHDYPAVLLHMNVFSSNILALSTENELKFYKL